MKDDDFTGNEMSRRQWIKRAAVPVIATPLATGVFFGRESVAQSHNTSSQKNGRGLTLYNVRDYGAVGDGVTLDTRAVQAAIDACYKDEGGTVVVPPGVYLIGTIELKSNVTLHVVAAGKLLGSADGKQYHAVDSIPLHGDSTLEDGNWALIFAVDAKNVTLEGPGVIDGQGLQFHSPAHGTPPPSGLGGNRRPYHLLCYRCENLRIRDIELLESAYHSLRIIQCKRVYLDSIYIHNRVNGNNDGFHFISAEYVTISNCTVQSQDDACALFGSCRFVTVTNCSFSTRWSVFRFGGGVAQNISISNCLIYQVYGCPIKFHGTPGSRFENISFSNLVLDDVTGPIHISIGPEQHQNMTGPEAFNTGSAQSIKKEPAVARNISFTNIHGTVTTAPAQLPDFPFSSGYRLGEGHSCITLNCVGNAILENIAFDNVHLTFGGGGTTEEAARRDLPQVAGEYFMLGSMPAYGFYARNARAITMQNIRFQVSTPDARPALIFDHSKDVSINGLSVDGNPAAESVIRLIDTEQTLLAALRLLTPAAVFLQLEGIGNSGIILDGGDSSKAGQAVVFREGAKSQALEIRQ